MATVEENVRRAYNGHGRGRDLNFHSRWVGPEKAASAVHEVHSGRKKGYNNFRPESVEDLVEAVSQGVDPNARFSVGREGSPVLYVETGKPKAVMGAVSSVMDPYRAPDEIGNASSRRGGVREDVPKRKRGKSAVRLWWD